MEPGRAYKKATSAPIPRRIGTDVFGKRPGFQSRYPAKF
jgi:hypothetical protein